MKHMGPSDGRGIFPDTLVMDQWLSHAPQLIVYLVGGLAIMAGSILFVGAFLLKPNVERPLIPSMRTQAQTIPPEYTAKKVAHGGRLGSALARERRLRRS